MSSDASTVTLPTGDELRSMSLETVPALFRNLVEYCKAQTLQIRSLERTIQSQRSDMDSLKESVIAASTKSDDVHASSRALGQKVASVEQEITRVSNVVRGSVTETIEAHLAGLQAEIQSTRKNSSDRLARMEDAFAADGIFLREVRSTARDVAAEAVTQVANGLRRETAASSASLTERLDALNDDVRRHGANVAEASAFVNAHRDSILGAAAAYEHLAALKARNAEIVDLRNRIDTAESAAAAATSSVDSLRADFTARVTAAAREAAEARHLAEQCVTAERLADETAAVEERRKEVTADIARAVAAAQSAADRLASRLASAEAQVQDVAAAQGALGDAAAQAELRVGALESEINAAGVSAIPARVEAAVSLITTLSARLERVESATVNQDYGVLQSALAHTRSRVEELGEVVARLPSGSDLETRAVEIAEGVATREVGVRVADCVAEEMVRVTGAAQRAAEAAVGEAMSAAVAELREAAEPRELRDVVDATVAALERTSSAWRTIAGDVESLQQRAELAQSEAQELSVAIGGARNGIATLDHRVSSLADRVGDTSDDATVMELLDGLRHSLHSLETNMGGIRDVVRLQASGTGLPNMGSATRRGRSPSASKPRAPSRGTRDSITGLGSYPPSAASAAAPPMWPRPRGSNVGLEGVGVAAHGVGLTPGRSGSFNKRDDALRFSRGVGMPGEL